MTAIANDPHAALDVPGLAPGLGNIADTINPACYLAEGDYVNAGLSGVAQIPGPGQAAASTRFASRAVDAGSAARGVVRGSDGVADVVFHHARTQDVGSIMTSGLRSADVCYADGRPQPHSGAH